MNIKPMAWAVLMAFAGAALAAPNLAVAQTGDSDSDDMARRIQALQAQINSLQAQLNVLKQQTGQGQAEPASAGQTAAGATSIATVASSKTADTEQDQQLASAAASEDEGITFGGAMRFQYSYEDYSVENTERIGDLDFDIFRLDMHGEVGGIVLDAQWRWFQYMSAMQHAWIAYNFNDTSQLQLGLTRIPFGNQAYNSHNYFFSSNYYIGLEDTHAMGAEYIYAGDKWNVQLAYFKNDGMGGIDGYVSDRTHSYSYNVLGVREPGEGNFEDPRHPAAAVNSLAARVARTLTPGEAWSIEFGASVLGGNLRDPVSKIGEYVAWALHMDADYKRWNFQAQASRYDYNTDSGATRLAVGAYAFYDSIAASADSYTFNVAYHLPVNWGPITGLDFYNDYSLITNKSGGLEDTFMNVLGVAASAGDLYTYFDYVTARNQPFVGGSMAGDGPVEHRFNINFGFYF